MYRINGKSNSRITDFQQGTLYSLWPDTECPAIFFRKMISVKDKKKFFNFPLNLTGILFSMGFPYPISSRIQAFKKWPHYTRIRPDIRCIPRPIPLTVPVR